MALNRATDDELAVSGYVPGGRSRACGGRTPGTGPELAWCGRSPAGPLEGYGVALLGNGAGDGLC